jgi:hypothetical protein
MDGAVAQRLGQRVVDEPVLVQQGKAVEARARDCHLEVVAAAGAVLDAQLGGVRKCTLEQASKGCGGHAVDRSGRLKAHVRTADPVGVLIRLVLTVVLVGAVGTFTGMIEPKEWLSKLPRVPTARVDSKEEYLRMVESNFDHVEPLSQEFFNRCNPTADRTSACTVLADQTLKALYAFQGDLQRASVPTELAVADHALRHFVVRGIEGFGLAQRALLTRKRQDWNRARDALAEASALLDSAGEALLRAQP